MKGTRGDWDGVRRWDDEDYFPYETMEESFDSFQLKHMHLIHGIITLQHLKRYTKTLTKSIQTNKFCKQEFETWNVFLKPEMFKPRGYLPLCKSVSNADVVTALKMHQIQCISQQNISVLSYNQ